MKMAARQFRMVQLMILISMCSVMLYAQKSGSAEPQKLSVEKTVYGSLKQGVTRFFCLKLKETYFCL